MTPGAEPRSSDALTPTASPATAGRKPRFALFIATACGLGYLPKAPGTFGSLAGIVLALVWWRAFDFLGVTYIRFVDVDAFRFAFDHKEHFFRDPYVSSQIAMTILVAAFGVWSATRAARFWQQKDPQRVVIDEVSGQHLTYLLGLAPALLTKVVTHNPDFVGYGLLFGHRLHYWKYLLLGLILFRVFDIWKPFPARQAESLRGGWGIMADDWIAGVYAAIGLWIARAAGL
jgi:phosphatidylglycerophosphatase A